MQFSFDFEADMHAAEKEAIATGEAAEVTFKGGRVTYRHSIHTNAKNRVHARRTFMIDGKRASRADAIALATEMELERDHHVPEAEPETAEHQAAIDLIEQAEVMGSVELPNGAELVNAATDRAERIMNGMSEHEAGFRNKVWIRLSNGQTLPLDGWEQLLDLIEIGHPKLATFRRKSRQRNLAELRECAEIMGVENPKACYWIGWHVMDERGRVGTGIGGKSALEALDGERP